MAEMEVRRCSGKFGDRYEFCDGECSKCEKEDHSTTYKYKTLAEIEALRDNKDYSDFYSWYKPVQASCSKCGGQLYMNDSIVLASYPPQYQYVCQSCGNVETSHIRLTPYYD